MFGAIGLLAALLDRGADGAGGHVDVSMLDCQISTLCYLAVYYLVSGEVPEPQGRGHISIPTYRSFVCADGRDIVVAANTEAMWQALCRMLELPELIEDARFQSNKLRNENREALWEQLEPAFRKRTLAEWLQLTRELDIPAAPVNTVDQALSDPQVRHRDMVVALHHGTGETVQLLGNPVKTSGGVEQTYEWPPEHGQHTRLVLRELLGLEPEEIAELETRGVISCGHSASER
jgi:crotonobetainyl-CoA:carnitine CoA-transferase CaiB-like acyl-CoA transferase